ncbi:MAG TPA: NAD-dependent epimerase/dehydratase family protein [Candidatus Paceibacterota bacterium]|nr:NAD-dependent epimerase/dehydratase family protein [Candidatus Paceibacterota bacterium]
MSKIILVTGGAGFIGSHLCERLAKTGYRVISLDNYFTGSRENHVPGVEYREGHTKDIEQLVPEAPDLVYHLGEYSRVEKSFEDIEALWDLNKTGTFAVLEFVRRRGAKLIYAGSSTKFADGGIGREQSPYAWAKATNTELVRNYGAWYGIDYAITYFYNVYGRRERAGAFGTVIEIFKRSYLAGRPIGLVAPGTQERNFTHVDDIVDGLLLVGEKGHGDDYGLGDERAYSILEVARMFSEDIVMLPERSGNRMASLLETEKARALGWKPQRSLAAYIEEIKRTSSPSAPKGNRILVFTTTFHPIMGDAERALALLMEKMPDVEFDIVTAMHTPEASGTATFGSNARVYHVGWGTRFDKYLLPFWGAAIGHRLAKEHDYLFSWSVMASYGTLAALAVRRRATLPLLVTLADQRLSWYERLFLRLVMGQADQVYASLPEQSRTIASLARRMRDRRSLGEGDAFANQIRFAYGSFLAKLQQEKRMRDSSSRGA